MIPFDRPRVVVTARAVKGGLLEGRTRRVSSSSNWGAHSAARCATGAARQECVPRS